MRLMEAGAVMLIVAGVLLGPIEPRNIQDWGWEETYACLGEINGGLAGVWERRGFCRARSFETLAKTCARAMREIGFKPDYSSLRQRWRGPDGRFAYCIPAPSGLAR